MDSSQGSWGNGLQLWRLHIFSDGVVSPTIGIASLDDHLGFGRSPTSKRWRWAIGHVAHSRTGAANWGSPSIPGDLVSDEFHPGCANGLFLGLIGVMIKHCEGRYCLRCHGMFAVLCNDCDSWNRVSKWFWWHCGGGKQTWNGIKHWLDLKRSLVYILSVAAYYIDRSQDDGRKWNMCWEMHIQFVGSQNLSFRPSCQVVSNWHGNGVASLVSAGGGQSLWKMFGYVICSLASLPWQIWGIPPPQKLQDVFWNWFVSISWV